jgi:phosphoribosylanthranilate isomerase
MQFKICCISNIQEAILAINSGAFAIGLVGEMPSGPGIIKDEEIYNIANNEKVKGKIETFLLTSETKAIDIIAHFEKCKTSTIQIVDALENSEYAVIRTALPNVKLVQVIHVVNEQSVEEALKKANYVDFILLDSGNPNATIKELGGTGRAHNWEWSKKIVMQCNKPVFLAGGLNGNNVKKAIETVKPFGVDICSGVRTNGNLDINKLNSFTNSIL